MMRRILSLALVALVAPSLVLAQADERLRSAKALFLDRQYDEARSLLLTVRPSGGDQAQQALYWIARCSESLGEHERALGEYGEFLAGRPGDRTLAEEARTSRIALAVKLARTGTPRRDREQHLGLAREALTDASRTVRYFAALQLASLGPEHGRAAVPVLKEILAKESDPDLVDRAKLYLVRLDPAALAPARGTRQQRRAHRLDPGPHLREGKGAAAGRDQPPGRARGDGVRGAAGGHQEGAAARGLRRRQLLGAAQEDGQDGHPDGRRRRRRAHPGLDRVGGIMKKVLMAALVLGALASPSAADRADDDLAAVKKAVGTQVEAEAKPPAEEPAAAREEQTREEQTRVERRRGERARSRRGEPQWIRVRIAEKGEKHARVSLNLPLGLVRALGEDVKIEDGHHGQHTLGEILRVLDSGENLVDIEDEDATVRVWVE